MQETKRFHALDSFRGICALSVVAFHLHIVDSFTEIDFFRNADLFVELFFVLSGFVLAHSYGEAKDLEFRRFFISRSFRLIPLHVFMLGIFLILETLKLLAYRKGFVFNNPPFTGSFSPLEIIPNLLLVQSWTWLTDSLSFNFPSWSISIEYYTYMIFAATVIFTNRNRKFIWFAISITAFMLIYSQAAYLTSFSLRGLSCFFAGALSYTAFLAVKNNLRVRPGLLTLLEIVLLGLIAVTMSTNFEQKNIALSALFCCTVVVFAFDGGWISKKLQWKPITFIGKLSYSIYLTHAAILFCILSSLMVLQKFTGIDITPMIDGRRYIDFRNPHINNLVAVSVLILVIGFSALTQKYIEEKFQALGKKIINEKNKQAILAQ